MSDTLPPDTSALTTFLEVPGDETDPRALLGLPDAPPERQAVLSALRSRLAQVASHARGTSPEASEVRILLHAAAARLLMPMTASSALPSRTPPFAASPETVATELDAAARAEFERGAMLILGTHGGLNPESLHALRVLALSHGVPAEQVVPEVMNMLGGATAPHAPPPESDTLLPTRRIRRHAPTRHVASGVADPGAPPDVLVAPRVLGEQVDPGLVFLKRVFIGAGLFIVLLIVAAFGLHFMTRSGPASKPTTPTPISGADARSTPITRPPAPDEQTTPTLTQTPAQPADTPRTIDALVQDIRSAATQSQAAPEPAMQQFERSIEALSLQWTDATPAQTAALVDASMEFVYRASTSADRAQRAITALVHGADLLSPRPTWSGDDARRACFSAGMLARLLRERDLPSGVLDDLRRRARPTLGDAMPADASFATGVTAAAGRLPGLLLGDDAPAPVKTDASAWTAYAQCVNAALARDVNLRQRILLGALERAVLADRDPHQDASVLAAQAALAGSVGFGAGSPARERLVQWLSREDIANSDLNTITGAVLDAKQNPELDITMVVSLNATALDRQELRARYESAWNVAGAAPPREVASKWVQRAAHELADDSPGAGAMERLVQATRLASLNAAAMRLQDGDATTVSPLLESSEIGVRFRAREGTTWASLSQPSDGGWAPRYLAAGADIPKRREVLSQVFSDPSPVEAAILVQEATRGSPAQVRAEARRVLAKYTTTPTVTAAMLDFASFIPPTRDNAAIVESVLGERLPLVRSPAWRVETRRALLRRMLELASSDESGFVDLAAEHLRLRYQEALGTPTTGPGSTEPRSVAEAAAALRERLSQDAKKIIVAPSGVPSVPEILARLSERRSRAEGDIQMFVAEQGACAELLALLTASERPGVGGAITAALDDWDTRRRSAPHVFEQAGAGERVLCRLWILRLGGEP